MRVAIIGSRSFAYDGLEEEVYAALCRAIPVNTTEIVSGGAMGVDTLAERYAKENKLNTKIFLPDYALYGKRAPLIRNEEIVDRAQFVIALWDGDSHGTAYTVASCLKKGVPVKILLIRRGENGEVYIEVR